MKTKYLYFSCAWLCATLALSQIPNGSFETWTNKDPDNWETSNTNSNSNIVSVTKVGSAKAGSNAMKLSAWAYQGFTFGPIAICPHSNSYFPYAGHPTMITGWYMASLQGGDKMMVSGALRKSHGTIGGGVSYFTTNTSVYQQFQVPISYTSTANSDSATMVVTLFSQSGGGTDLNPASYVIIDDIQFSNGTPNGVSELSKEKKIRLKQDLQTGLLRIEFDLIQSGPVNLFMCDLQGRVVREILSGNQDPGKFRVDHQMDDLPPAMYLLKLETVDGAVTAKVFSY